MLYINTGLRRWTPNNCDNIIAKKTSYTLPNNDITCMSISILHCRLFARHAIIKPLLEDHLLNLARHLIISMQNKHDINIIHN